MSKLWMNGVHVEVTALYGNLFVIGFPDPKSKSDSEKIQALKESLINAGCAPVSILSAEERVGELVCTADTYQHILPMHIHFGKEGTK